MVTVYTPNSQRELTRLDYRMQWEEAFLNYLNGLKAQKPVIFCGDLNVAHQEIDLKNLSKTLIENKVFDTSGKYLSNDNSKIKSALLEFSLYL